MITTLERPSFVQNLLDAKRDSQWLRALEGSAELCNMLNAEFNELQRGESCTQSRHGELSGYVFNCI